MRQGPVAGKMPPDNFKIGIYVRESRDDNEENYETIKNQKHLLMDFVKSNKYGEICGIYEDDNVSGSGFERPGLNNLKDDVAAGNINMLILKDLSRLGRNNAKTLLFLDYLEENGVRVLTFDGRYDSLKDNDTVGIDTWYNERYARDISRKIRASLRYKIEKGEYIGHAPYGYRKSEILKNKLVVNPETCLIVKNIFLLYREGAGYRHIADLLNKAGTPPPGGGKSWSSAAVYRILGNRVYIGDTIQGTSEKISFKTKKTRRLPAGCWVTTKNTHEGIISEAEFREVQKIRECRKLHPETYKRAMHLFSGMIFCGRCGSNMISRVRKNRPAGYLCSNYARYGKIACSSHFVRESIIIKAVKEELNQLFREDELLQKVTVLVEKELSSHRINVADLEKIRLKLNLKLKQQKTAYQDRLDGLISQQLFEATNKNLEKSIFELEHEMEILTGLSGQEFMAGKAIDKVRHVVLHYGPDHAINRILVNRIIVFDLSDTCDSEENKNSSNMILNMDKGAVLIEFNYQPNMNKSIRL